MATSSATERVPGPSTWLPGGAYWAFRKDPLAFFSGTARTYGDIAEQLGAELLRDKGDRPMTTRFTLRWPR